MGKKGPASWTGVEVVIAVEVVNVNVNAVEVVNVNAVGVVNQVLVNGVAKGDFR